MKGFIFCASARLKTVTVLFFISLIWLALFIQPAPAGSLKAPEFSLPDLKGEQTSLSGLAGKEKLLLLFWTTWCPHCQTALRDLKAKKINYRLVTINIGEPRERIERFFKSNGYNFTTLLDLEGEAAASYGVFGIPTFVIVEKDSTITYRDNVAPSDLE